MNQGNAHIYDNTQVQAPTFYPDASHFIYHTPQARQAHFFGDAYQAELVNQPSDTRHRGPASLRGERDSWQDRYDAAINAPKKNQETRPHPFRLAAQVQPQVSIPVVVEPKEKEKPQSQEEQKPACRLCKVSVFATVVAVVALFIVLARGRNGHFRN